MKELVKVYQDRGSQFIEDLLKDYVVITEKLSGSSFSFQKDGKYLSFYKGDNRKPLNLIDRTLMVYYEPPIKYISSLSSDILKEVPDNWRFGFQYFIHNHPGVIAYDNLPKNSLVLTHILVKDHRGKTAKVIEDPRVIKDWANKLGVTPIQPIFMGHLTEEQKEKLLTFLDIPVEDQMELFGTNSFVEYLITYLNPSVKSTLLNTDLSKPIDSIVFKFYKPGSTQTYSAKVVDPYTRSLMKERKPIDMRRAPADINEIVLLDILAFLEERGLKKHEVLSNTPEEKYLELISGLFNDYVEKRGDDLAKLDFQKADFAKAPEFDINYDLLRNEKTKELISGSDALKDLFKVMLGSLRKKRDPQKEGPLFTPSVIEDFNKMLDRIKKITEEEGDGQFKTFEDYLKLKNINEELYIKEDLMDLICEETYLNFKDFVNIEKFAIHEALKVPHKNQGKNKVNMFAGRFQPFTLGHVKVLEDLHKQNGHPVMVMIVRGKKTDPKRAPFDEDTQQRMVAALQSQYPFIEGSVVVPNGAIDTMFSSLRPTYEPVLWGYGTDRKGSYDGQIQHDSYRAQLGVLPEFQGHEIKRGDEDVSASKVRNALERDDRKGYEKLVPRSLHDFYDELQNIMVPIEEGLLTEGNKATDYLDNIYSQTAFKDMNSTVRSYKKPEIFRAGFGTNPKDVINNIKDFVAQAGYAVDKKSNQEISGDELKNLITVESPAWGRAKNKPSGGFYTWQVSMPRNYTYNLGSGENDEPIANQKFQQLTKTGFNITNNSYKPDVEGGGVAAAGCPKWSGNNLNPAWWGVDGTKYMDAGVLITALETSPVLEHGSMWHKMLVGTNSEPGLARLVYDQSTGTSANSIEDLIDKGNSQITYDVSSLFGEGAPYESFLNCGAAIKSVQNSFGEILGAIMLDNILKNDEPIFFPTAENYPLVDFEYGTWGISSKGGKGASPSIKGSFEAAEDVLKSIVEWGDNPSMYMTSDEAQFITNIVEPFITGTESTPESFYTYANLANQNVGMITTWDWMKEQAEGGGELTPSLIQEWLRKLAFNKVNPTEAEIDNADGEPLPGQRFGWKSAVGKMVDDSGTKIKQTIDDYWNAYKDDVKANKTTPEISPVMYPVTVQTVKWLNRDYRTLLTTLFQKLLTVQQIHMWAKLNKEALLFQFRPFSVNEFEFSAKANMGNYTVKGLSFHMAGVKITK